jgi:hypothetical protein
MSYQLAAAAQLYDDACPSEEPCEQRKTLPLHVAFHVPLPSGRGLTFDI